MARNAIESEFRTSKMADRSEMQSTVIFGHPKWPPKKKKFCIDLKWPKLISKVNFRHPKWPIDLKWPEMQSKVIFEHPKCPPAAILSKLSQKNKVAYRSEMASEFQTSKMADRSQMARNAIESEFRTYKMADGGHFVKLK